jgi:F5/8 type C domain
MNLLRRELARFAPNAAVAAFAVHSLVACRPSEPPVEPDPPYPPADVAIEPLEPRQPLVIAAASPEPIPSADTSCELQLTRLPSDCRVIPVVGVSATATEPRSSAGNAFDGSTCTTWNAGNFAPQSITVDLGTPTDVDAIVLVPEMTPNGQVRQRIEFSDDGKTFVSAHRIEAPMASAVPVELIMPKRERTRFVRVVSDASPSWVAWREIALVRCGRVQR